MEGAEMAAAYSSAVPHILDMRRDGPESKL
jgi:hypothetical protein